MDFMIVSTVFTLDTFVLDRYLNLPTCTVLDFCEFYIDLVNLIHFYA